MKSYITLEELDQERCTDGYELFLVDIEDHFTDVLSWSAENNNAPLFHTDAGDLFAVFLECLPDNARQHYNCHACRRFVNAFGDLVYIAENGHHQPAIWPAEEKVPDFFKPAVRALRRSVVNARVNGVLITNSKILGTPKTGSWNHMAVAIPKLMQHHSPLRSCAQAAAEKAEDHRLLAQAVSGYSMETLNTAYQVLLSERLYRGERFLGNVEWLRSVKEKWAAARKRGGPAADNILWRESAIAPVGFCHISSSMVGTLLDDIGAGMSFDEAKARFDTKMDPLKYQRPQVAPSAGNIARAEEIVEKLGLAPSFKRRYARLEDIDAIWTPPKATAPAVKGSGLFADLAAKTKQQKSTMVMPEAVITFRKFTESVLPHAKKLELFLGSGQAFFGALVTAEDPDAPPIIAWDKPEHRNPVSWYVYSGGSFPVEWGLRVNQYVPVTAISLQPNLWQDGFEKYGKGVFFILDGCRDLSWENCSAGLFPEILSGSLHEVRATIEAYSAKHHPSEGNKATACGLRLQAGQKWNACFRVTTDAGESLYRLDRWD